MLRHLKNLSKNNFQCMRHIKSLIFSIFLRLNNNEIVIAPGDSLIKFIKIIQIVYGDNDRYTISDDVDHKDLHIKFITFPLSSISGYADKKLLDNYISYVISTNNILSTDNFVYLDFIYGGGSAKNIIDSFKRTLNKDIEFTIINLANYSIANEACENALKFIFDVSEGSSSRCMAKFNLYEKIEPSNINLLRCNVIIAILSLILYNKI